MKVIFGILTLTLIAFFGLNNSHASSKLENSFANQDTVKSQKKAATEEEVGIGPIKEVTLGPINEKFVNEGKKIFNTKCMACHRLDTKLVGPALKPIVKKLSPVYLMNYLLNTTEMQKKDPKLKKLIKEYNGVVMPDQQLKEPQARAVLEYFRSIEK
ncbi:MAG: cytochrome c [Bacteroidetes bacterium]|nr:cytochrome c [Bacteroidota bacterium]